MTKAAETDAKHVVLSFVDALNHEDFEAAKRYVSDNISFVGVLGSRRGSYEYFVEMQRMRLKYDVKRTFVDGHDVCLFYDLTISGTTIFGCGWYHVEQRRIDSLQVLFDPRPVLEASMPKARHGLESSG